MKIRLNKTQDPDTKSVSCIVHLVSVPLSNSIIETGLPFDKLQTTSNSEELEGKIRLWKKTSERFWSKFVWSDKTKTKYTGMMEGKKCGEGKEWLMIQNIDMLWTMSHCLSNMVEAVLYGCTIPFVLVAQYGCQFNPHQQIWGSFRAVTSS